MMNNPLFKCLMIFPLFVFTIIPKAEAQFLDISPIGQQKTQWCWAASMEMVTQFYGKSLIDQCTLAKQLQILKGEPSTSNCCDHLCSKDSSCNETIPYSKREGNIDVQYLDMLFSNNGFFSVEDTNTPLMDSAAIVNEIQACRPFLIFLNKWDQSIQFITYNHVVVAKGYYSFLDMLYVLVNDPQRGPVGPECEGCEFFLPITIFSDRTDGLSSAHQVVRSVYPREESFCDGCSTKRVVDSTYLVKAIENNNSELLLIGNDTIEQVELENLLQMTNSNGDSQFYKQNYFFADALPPTDIDTLILLGVENTSPPMVFYLEKSNTSWVVKSITTAQCTPLITTGSYSFILVEDNQVVDTVFQEVNTIDIIETVPDLYQFYKIEYKEEVYYSPVQNYPSLPFKKDLLYREKEVKKEVFDRYKKRGCFEWLFRNRKNKTRKIKSNLKQ